MLFSTPMLHRAPLKAIAAAPLIFFCWAPAAIAQTHTEDSLAIVILDESKLPVLDARVEIKSGDKVIAAAATNDSGHAEFACEPGIYSITASKEGFETAVVQEVECKKDAEPAIELTLKPAASKQTVEVHDTISAAAVSSAPMATLDRETAKELPSRPATVSDALPLIPGIARQPSGQLQLSGGEEHRSTMMVNSADVTDPATGEFGQTVPIDSVEKIDFYQASFLAEYGRYSVGRNPPGLRGTEVVIKRPIARVL